MRTSRLLILVVLAGSFACKTSKPTTSEEVYKEDLSSLRPDLKTEVESPKEEEPKIMASDLPQGHLKAELDSINEIIIARNREQQYVDGFTIQIYTGNDREAATAAMQLASVIRPELDAQIEYHQPSYKVKAGQYLDRLKAHEVFESLKEEFPLALLIPERIRIDYD